MKAFLRRSLSAIWLCLLVALIVAACCSNRADVFIGGRVYFLDGDCYARMTRVRMVLEHPATIIRHHDFENYPQGITTHTTAPFDYLIAALKKILDFGFWISGKGSGPWAAQTLDLAGAIVAPLLGVLTLVFLWFWSRRLELPYRGMMLMLYAVSPIIVHGNLLGRPRHLSLCMFLMTVALGSEWALASGKSKSGESKESPAPENQIGPHTQITLNPHSSRHSIATPELSSLNCFPIWALIGGVAWGLGLWVTLYEPLILLAAIVALNCAFGFRNFFTRTRGIEFGIAFGILALSIWIEGWRLVAPDPAILQFFPNWQQTIGELAHLTPLSPAFFGWVGLLYIAAPLLFLLCACAGNRHWSFPTADRRALPLLLFIAAIWALTLWQMRWGYFFAIIFAMSLPIQMSVIRWRFIAWPLFVISLWPVASEWDGRLFPEGEAQMRITEERADKVLLRDAAEHLKSDKQLAVLAPWWFSPPLAYWSGQPAVCGTSHESLPGIVDAARFFMASDPDVARKILQSRKVSLVVAYDTERVLHTSSTLLGQQVPEMSMAKILYERPHSTPEFLKFEYRNSAFKVFSTEY